MTQTCLLSVFGVGREIAATQGDADWLAVLTGENGIGKTSLLKHLVQLPERRTGPIVLPQRLPEALERVASIANSHKVYIAEDPRMQFLGFTYADEIRLLAANFPLCEPFSSSPIATEVSTRAFDELSGGQMQICNTLTGLRRKAEVVFLDEPDAWISEENMTSVLDVCRCLCDRCTFVIATHRPHVYSRLSPAVWEMRGEEASAHEEEVGSLLRQVRTWVECLARRDVEITGDNLAARYPLGRMVISSLGFRFSSSDQRPHVISGANGSGKTTLLRLIAGLLKKKRGSMRRRPKRPRISYAPQRPSAFFLDEELAHEAHCRGLDIADGMDIQQLSFGQLKVLSVALASATDSDIYLFDEPLAGLGPNGRTWAIDTIHELAEKRLVVVTTSSQLEDIDGIHLHL